MDCRINRSILLLVLLVSCVCVSGCGQESTEHSGVADKKVVGRWQGQSINPEMPSRNMWQQPCWVIDRKQDGTYTVTEFVVDHEKRVYTKVGYKSEGRWRLDGMFMLQRLNDESDWRKYRITWRGNSLVLHQPGSDEYAVEEKLNCLPSGYSTDYRSLSEAEFDNR